MFARVIVDISNNEVDRVYDYDIPDYLGDVLGYRVLVPFGPKGLVGFVLAVSDTTEVDSAKIKPILDVLDEYPILTAELLSLTEYLHTDFNIRYVDAIRLFIPPKLRTGAMRDKMVDYVSFSETMTADEAKALAGTRSENRLRLIDYLQGGVECELAFVNKEFGSPNVKFLLAAGAIKIEQHLERRKPVTFRQRNTKNITLTAAQQQAVDTIIGGSQETYLLHGVTGSGKTEIYLHTISRVLQSGRNVIVLAPEISLTPQLIARFEGMLGEGIIAIQHSKLTERERYDEWARIKSGEARVVIGARSAVFSPIHNLGMIIIDEEHDGSYVSESNPRYNTIDIAQYRASLVGGKVVLGSATPSLDTYREAVEGRYGLITLPTRAVSGSHMPQYEIVDMTAEAMNGNMGLMSMRLIADLADCLDKRGQAMIFLNRRGFASFLMCKKCGYVAKCEDCDVALTYHREDNQLKCHYCNRRYKTPTACPHCGNMNLRQGKVGTERVVEELQRFFPQARILRMDYDTTEERNSYLKILDNFRNKESDILVGTQMIAKGHDFPDVTLVGIIDADMNLYNSDYKSIERSYQLITQVAGRSGRGEKAGKVVLQTYSPRHYVFRFAERNDYIGFYKKEINLREVTKFPPFTKFVRILITSEWEEEAIKAASELLGRLRIVESARKSEFVYLQAMKAPIGRKERRYIYQILIRLARTNERELLHMIYAEINKTNQKKSSIWVELNPSQL